jgi:hypothetical protein
MTSSKITYTAARALAVTATVLLCAAAASGATTLLCAAAASGATSLLCPATANGATGMPESSGSTESTGTTAAPNVSGQLGAAPSGGSRLGPASTLTAMPDAAPTLSAYDGYVVWSAYDASSQLWQLTEYHNGTVAPLADLAGRTIPFDAQAGPGPDGAPVIVYSRCQQEPPPPPPALFYRASDWARGRGCRLYEAPLDGGAEHALHEPGAAGASDTTPAIWHHEIVFARLERGGRRTEILLWSGIDRSGTDRSGTGRLRRLAGGPSGEAGAAPPFIAQMAIGAHGAAFVWQQDVPGDYDDLADWVLRVDPLPDGRPFYAAQSQVSGECGYAEPFSPSFVGDSVLYAFDYAKCESPGDAFASISLASPTHYLATRSLTDEGPPYILGAAQAGDTTYWIEDQQLGGSLTEGTPTPDAGDCVHEPVSCMLVSSTALHFSRRLSNDPNSQYG